MTATSAEIDRSPGETAPVAALIGRDGLQAGIRDFLDSSEQYLLIEGGPGTGKTTFLRQLADELDCLTYFAGPEFAESLERDDPLIGAHALGAQILQRFGHDVFEWSRMGLEGSAKAIKVEGVLAGLHADLLRGMPGIGSAARYRGFASAEAASPGAVVAGIIVEKLVADPETALKQLVVEPLAKALARDQARVILLIDALDEWNHAACRPSLLQMIAARRWPPHFRIAVAARPGTIVGLERAPFRIIDLDDTASSADNDRDIRRFIESQVAGLPLASSAARSSFIEKAVAAAGGNFLYVTYLLREAREDPGVVDAADLPQGLDAIYDRLIRRLLAQQDPASARWLPALLSLLAVAAEPLSADQIEQYSGLELAVWNCLRRALSPYLRESSGRYSVYHRSFAEYLGRRAGEHGVEGLAGHRQMLARAGLRRAEQPDWAALDSYLLRHWTSHWLGAGFEEAAMTALLTAPPHVEAKADRLGAGAVVADLRKVRQDPEIRCLAAALLQEIMVGEAALPSCRPPLVKQLAVRLRLQDAAELAERYEQAAAAKGYEWPRPDWGTSDATGKMLYHSLRTSPYIRTFATAREANVLAVLCDSRRIELWHCEDGLMFDFEAEANVHALALAPGGSRIWYAVERNDGDVILTRAIRPGDPVAIEFATSPRRIKTMACSADGHWLAWGTSPGSLIVIDAATGGPHLSVQTGESRVTDISFSSDSAAVVATTLDLRFIGWRLDDGSLIAAVALESMEPQLLARRSEAVACADGHTAAVGCNDYSVRVIDLADGEETSKLSGLGGWIDAVDFHCDLLVSGNSEGVITLWRPGEPQPRQRFRAHSRRIVGIETGHAAGTVLTLGEDGTAHFWQFEQGLASASDRGHAAPVTGIAVDGEMQQAVSAAADGTLILWEVADGRQIRRATVPVPRQSRVLPAADLQRALIVAEDRVKRSIIEWSDDGPVCGITVQSKCDDLLSAVPAFVSASADLETVARGLDVFRGEAAWRCEVEVRCGGAWIDAEGGTAALSIPDGIVIVTLENGGEARIATDESAISPLLRHGGCAFIAAASLDSCSLWSLAEGPPARLWTADADRPGVAVLSSDGNLLAVAGERSLAIFRARTGEALARLKPYPPITAMSFVPGSRRLICGDAGGNLMCLRFE